MVIVDSVIGLLSLSVMGGCDLFDPSEPSCAGTDCFGMPRMVVGILQYDEDLESCENVEIVFEDSEGDILTNNDAGPDEPNVCSGPYEEQVAGLLWTACRTCGPAVKWIDVTISQDEDRTTTQRIELAEHNYCGVDIAYVLVTLHEDDPPTFGEVMYISPCETGGL